MGKGSGKREFSRGGGSKALEPRGSKAQPEASSEILLPSADFKFFASEAFSIKKAENRFAVFLNKTREEGSLDNLPFCDKVKKT